MKQKSNPVSTADSRLYNGRFKLFTGFDQDRRVSVPAGKCFEKVEDVSFFDA
jgi:hypothetical protein